MLAILRLGVFVLDTEEDCRTVCKVGNSACLVDVGKDQQLN